MTIKINIKNMTILAAFLAIVSFAVWAFGYGALTDTRPRITEGEYAMAWVQCQNVLSKHNYYHGLGNHVEELLDIWVKEDGEYAKTATWSNPNGVWEGMDLIKVFYGNPKTKDPKQTLKEMKKNEPFVAGKGSWGIHMNTTPVIEVAGDGKSARGIWFSPGVVMNYTGQKDKDGNDLAQGTWFWEKYGIDFVKEDGEWKIWHLQTYYDFTPPVGSESKWTNPATIQSPMAMQKSTDKKDEKAQVADAMGNLPKPSRENPDPYPQWSPTRVNTLRPELPEPYYTFDETANF